MQRLLIFIAAMLLVSSGARAETYYVSPGGDDAASGTSGHSWKTLAKVNSFKFAPGDTILLMRNHIWREQLTISSSGAPDRPITYGCFGKGNPPLISGADQVTNWSAAGDGVYRADFAMQPANLYGGYNGLEVIPLQPQASAAAVAKTPGSWFYDAPAKQIVLRLANGSDPNGREINAAVRKFGVLSEGHSFVTVQDLVIQQVTQAGFYFWNPGLPTGTEADNYGGNFNEFNTIQRCGVRNYGSGKDAGWDGGIYVRSNLLKDGPKPMLRGWRILDNVIGRMEDLPKIDYDRGGIWLRGTTGALVDGNEVSTVNKYGISVRGDFNGQGSFGPTVIRNELTGNFTNIAIADTDHATVAYNWIHDSAGMGIGIGNASYAVVAHNTIDNLRESGDKILYNGIDINNQSREGRAFYNSVRQVASACITLEGDNGKPSDGWIVRHNVFEGAANVESIANQHSVVYIAKGVTKWTFGDNVYVDSPEHLSKAIQYPSGTYFGEDEYRKLTGDTTSKFTSKPQLPEKLGPIPTPGRGTTAAPLRDIDRSLRGVAGP